MSLHFRNRTGTDSMGIKYVFGIFLYDMKYQPTLDIILGNRMLTIFWKK